MNVHFKIRYRDMNLLLKDTTTSSTDLIVDKFVLLEPVHWGETRMDQLISYCIDNQIDINTVTILEDSMGNKLHTPLIQHFKTYLDNKLGAL